MKSEWQGMQTKPNTKLRDLLKSNKAKTRKLSELSKTEQNRLAKLNGMLDELKRYEDKLKKAIFNYSRTEGYSTKGKHSTAKKFYNSSERLYEEALEILQELLHADASIQQWFDRALDLDADGDLGLTPVAMPRVVTSRSLDRQTTDSRLISKREVKIATVEWAISALLAVETIEKKN